MLAVALGFLTVGFGGYAFVESPWHGFLASAITGIGNGIFWPAQSTLIAGLTPPERRPAAFAMQRVVMNLGIGIGGLAGGFLAATSFRLLFLADALTFVAYAAVLLAFVPEPARSPAEQGSGRHLPRRPPPSRLHRLDRAQRRLHHRRHGPDRADRAVREERGRHRGALDRRGSSPSTRS